MGKFLYPGTLRYSTLYLIDKDNEIWLGRNTLKIIKERFMKALKFPKENEIHMIEIFESLKV